MIGKYLRNDDAGVLNIIPPASPEELRNINCHKFVLFVVGSMSRAEMLSDSKAEVLADPHFDFTFGKKILALSQKEFTPISRAKDLIDLAGRECDEGKMYIGQIQDAETGGAAHSFIVERNLDGTFNCFGKEGFKHHPFRTHSLESLLDFVNEKGEKSYQNQLWRFFPLEKPYYVT